MSFWPNKGEIEQRPEQGQPYKVINPIASKTEMRR
jgi:hypothetical protein